MTANLIEGASLFAAIVIGFWMIALVEPLGLGAACAFVTGIACGGLGSRLAAIARERATLSGIKSKPSA